MSKLGKVVLGAIVVWIGLTVLHLHLNLGVSLKTLMGTESGNGVTEERFRVGFLPVTCHLTCPVTDWINKSTVGKGFYEPVRFSGFPEIKESIIAGHLPATFMLAPLAMALVEQGVPVKIVYLGHRDGTALMVQKDSDVLSVRDLRGKRVAIPNRFSNQNLLLRKALADQGMSIDEVEILEMPPPDMPAALYSKAVDGITSGEPFMAQTEMDGYGRVLYQAKDIWPDFISCVLVVSQKTIDEHPEWVQQLVDGIAKSGLWLEDGMDHRMAAAQAVATGYYNQEPRLLSFVLSKPPDRVKYSNLRLARAEFDQIVNMAVDAGVLKRRLKFEEYADSRFSEKTVGAQAHTWQGR